MNVVPFFLKGPIGQLAAGPGRMVYDRMAEQLKIAGNFRGDEAEFIAEPPPMIELPQKAVSRIHFQKALIFGGGTLVIRLRNGKRSEHFETFGVEEIELPILKSQVPKAEELVTEVKFDLFEDTLDDMLEDTDVIYED